MTSSPPPVAALACPSKADPAMSHLPSCPSATATSDSLLCRLVSDGFTLYPLRSLYLASQVPMAPLLALVVALALISACLVFINSPAVQELGRRPLSLAQQWCMTHQCT